MKLKPWPDTDQHHLDVQNIVSAEYKLPPGMIYHYTCIDTARKIIEGSKLKFSCPTEFNDPFDMYEGLVDFSYTPRQYREWLKLNMNTNRKERRKQEALGERSPEKVMQGFREALLKLKKGSGVCCFSKLPDQLLMWSHYADKHKGIVLGFNILPYMKEEMDNFIIFEVNYLNKIEKLNYHEHGEKILRHWALSKSIEWEYEQEVRAIIKDRKSKSFFEFDKACIKAVYFGCNTPTNQQNEIINLLNDNDYIIEKRRKMIIDDNTFNIKALNI